MVKRIVISHILPRHSSMPFILNTAKLDIISLQTKFLLINIVFWRRKGWKWRLSLHRFGVDGLAVLIRPKSRRYEPASSKRIYLLKNYFWKGETTHKRAWQIKNHITIQTKLMNDSDWIVPELRLNWRAIKPKLKDKRYQPGLYRTDSEQVNLTRTRVLTHSSTLHIFPFAFSLFVHQSFFADIACYIKFFMYICI